VTAQAPDALYAVVDVDAAARAGWPAVDLARAFVAGGARFLQLRAKSLSGSAFLDAATAIVDLAHRGGARVVVNDRADIARLAGADGVHVGQDDLPPRAVREQMGPHAIVGLSTHTVAQLEAAGREPVDYVAIGPVFPTLTKDTGYEAVGLRLVRAAAACAGTLGLPLVAIGGITLERAPAVREAGAASVAVISDLLAGEGPEQRVREYLVQLGNV
jgi:thiamine-phosphate pyrophosphorylase